MRIEGNQPIQPAQQLPTVDPAKQAAAEHLALSAKKAVLASGGKAYQAEQAIKAALERIINDIQSGNWNDLAKQLDVLAQSMLELKTHLAGSLGTHYAKQNFYKQLDWLRNKANFGPVADFLFGKGGVEDLINNYKNIPNIQAKLSQLANQAALNIKEYSGWLRPQGYFEALLAAISDRKKESIFPIPPPAILNT